MTVLRLLRSLRQELLLMMFGLRHRVRFFRQEVKVARGSYIAPGVVIGRRTRINAASHLDPCEIGSYCAIGGRLVVRYSNHHTRFLGVQQEAQRRIIGGRSLLEDPQPVTIGHGVWIGDSVVILAGVTVGNGAIIGAGSVVTRSVPAYGIAVGNPARLVRLRYPEAVVEVLEKCQWWTWDDERLRRNRALFDLDLTTVDPAELARMIERA